MFTLRLLCTWEKVLSPFKCEFKKLQVLCGGDHKKVFLPLVRNRTPAIQSVTRHLNDSVALLVILKLSQRNVQKCSYEHCRVCLPVASLDVTI